MRQALFLLGFVPLALFAGGPQPSDRAAQLLERYRYTAEPGLLADARANIAAALKQDPANATARKLEAYAALLDEDYATALQLASSLNRKYPDDVEIYGYLVDAQMAFGDYKDAEDNANWMMRLRPQNTESLRRVAALRETFGDVEGALLTLNEIFRATPEGLALERAWALASIARLTAASNPQRAEALARHALKIAPESLDAALAPGSDRAVLAQCYGRTGRLDVLAQYDPEAFGRLSVDSTKPSVVRARIEYLAAAGRNEEALILARKHAAVYANAWSLGLLAMALDANGQRQEAVERMKAALAVGSRDARLIAWAAKVGVKQ